MKKNISAKAKKPLKKKSPPPQMQEDIEQEPKQSRLKRLLFGEEKPDLSELEAGSTTILDILSPTAVDTKSRDHIVVDGIFHAYLYVAGYGYTTTVGAGWLSALVEAGEGVSLSFTVKRQPKDKVLSKIAQTTMVNRSRMREVGDTRSDYEELDSAIASGLYLKDVMNRQGEDFYYMHTLVEVTAEDGETLEQRVAAVETLCVSMDMIARRCDYKQEQAFLSALPVLALDPDIERKARRNALTSGVAAAFPFASYELSDKNGIFLGLNMYNKSPAFLDFYDDYKYTNGSAVRKLDVLATPYFSFVWEAICGYLMNNQYSKLKSLLPQPVWEGRLNAGAISQRPDIFRVADSRLYILDAKYYDFNDHLPGWHDVVKQLFYRHTMQAVWETRRRMQLLPEAQEICNAFLFPGNECDFQYIGKVYVPQAEELGEIRAFAIKQSLAFRAYAGQGYEQFEEGICTTLQESF